MRITFKREPRETGLMGVGQGTLGYDVRVDGIRVASVRPLTNNRYTVIGWGWSCPTNEAIGTTWHNTYSTPVDTVEEAKAEAKAYILSCIQREA